MLDSRQKRFGTVIYLFGVMMTLILFILKVDSIYKLLVQIVLIFAIIVYFNSKARSFKISLSIILLLIFLWGWFIFNNPRLYRRDTLSLWFLLTPFIYFAVSLCHNLLVYKSFNQIWSMIKGRPSFDNIYKATIAFYSVFMAIVLAFGMIYNFIYHLNGNNEFNILDDIKDKSNVFHFFYYSVLTAISEGYNAISPIAFTSITSTAIELLFFFTLIGLYFGAVYKNIK